MTADPFQTPSAPRDTNPQPGSYGRMDIGRAFSEGWELMKSNFWGWLGVSLIGGLICSLAGVALLIPLLIVGPAIAWGYTRFQLEVYEGRGRFDHLWDGFSALGTALGGFLLFYLVTGGLSLIPSFAAGFAEAMEAPVLAGLANLGSLVITVISFRWGFAVFFIVEHRMNGLDAIQASWRATQGQWGTLIGFAIVAVLVVLAGIIALGVGVFPAAAVVAFANVSMYRQLVGPAAARAA